VTNEALGSEEKVAFKDKISIVQITVSALIAVIGLTFTYAQFDATEKRTAADRRNKQFESFLTLSEQCASDDASARARISRVIFEYRGNPNLGRDAALEEVMISCTKLITERDAGPATPGSATPGAKATPSPASPQPTAPPTGAEAAEIWVYLGTYRNKVWETRYLDFPKGLDPSAYTKASPGTYAVRYDTGALNVRTGPFSPATGAFPPVTSSLAPGRKVRILSTWPWSNSDNWWAKVQIL
jgi:hypothetical protein